MSQFDPGLTEKLEALIDANNLQDVLSALATVAAEKAEHLQNNWQDAASARCWLRASDAIERLANTSAVKNVA